eukprot:534846-Rhodomonas_salina.1
MFLAAHTQAGTAWKRCQSELGISGYTRANSPGIADRLAFCSRTQAGGSQLLNGGWCSSLTGDCCLILESTMPELGPLLTRTLTLCDPNWGWRRKLSHWEVWKACAQPI